MFFLSHTGCCTGATNLNSFIKQIDYFCTVQPWALLLTLVGRGNWTQNQPDYPVSCDYLSVYPDLPRHHQLRDFVFTAHINNSN